MDGQRVLDLFRAASAREAVMDAKRETAAEYEKIIEEARKLGQLDAAMRLENLALQREVEADRHQEDGRGFLYGINRDEARIIRMAAQYIRAGVL